MASPNLALRSKQFLYKPRKPEKTVLYQTIQHELETWLSSAIEDIPYFVEGEFRTFLKCGILAYGFANLICRKIIHRFTQKVQRLLKSLSVPLFFPSRSSVAALRY